jgi:hypothetical protein
LGRFLHKGESFNVVYRHYNLITEVGVQICISLIVLHILEKGLAKGLSLDSLDDHEALVSVLPEFKVGGGHM